MISARTRWREGGGVSASRSSNRAAAAASPLGLLWLASSGRADVLVAWQLATDLAHWSKVLEAGEMAAGPLLRDAVALLQLPRDEYDSRTAAAIDSLAGDSQGGEQPVIHDTMLLTTIRKIRGIGSES
jgi:hypothetical protein